MTRDSKADQIRQNELTLGKIFKFWLPLAATWLMMAFEGPFIAAIIARLADPKYNLAAYGISFSFALIIEAPIIMLMSAAIAIVKSRTSYIRLKRFTHYLNVSITLLMLGILLPEPFRFITQDLMQLPSELISLTHISTWLLLPWPAAIGYRRFYQGILIADGQTRKVAMGTVVRLATMISTATFIYFIWKLPGAFTGSIALSCGVILEALAARIMVHSTLKSIHAGLWQKSDETERSAPGYSAIISFYTPLALSSLIALGINPMVSFFLGQSRMPIESLAVLPVINSLQFVFSSMGLSFQEVGVALLNRTNEGYRQLCNFAWILGSILTIGICSIAFTPLSSTWFIQISGLQPSLAEFALIPLQIIVLLPGSMVLMSFQRALLMNVKKSRFITWATAIEATGIISVLVILINAFDLIGAIAASTAFLVGRIASVLYLFPPFFKSVQT